MVKYKKYYKMPVAGDGLSDDTKFRPYHIDTTDAEGNKVERSWAVFNATNTECLCEFYAEETVFSAIEADTVNVATELKASEAQAWGITNISSDFDLSKFKLE